MGSVNTTAPVLASETAYITAFTHFLLSRPTPLSLRSVEPRRPCRALCTHLALYSALTLHTAAPSVQVLPHFLDISAFLRLSLAHRTAFPHIGPLSHASPGVPLAPPGHIVPSLPHSLSVPLFLDGLATLLVYNACNYTLDHREFCTLFPLAFPISQSSV
jgi:hypothetical protein